MSTKPPIAARIPSARPRTLLTGSRRASSSCALDSRAPTGRVGADGRAGRSKVDARRAARLRLRTDLPLDPGGSVLRRRVRRRSSPTGCRSSLGLSRENNFVVPSARDVARQQCSFGTRSSPASKSRSPAHAGPRFRRCIPRARTLRRTRSPTSSHGVCGRSRPSRTAEVSVRWRSKTHGAPPVRRGAVDEKLDVPTVREADRRSRS